MPIKLKKTNIQYDIETPDEGWVILGFDESGNMVTKNDQGEYEPIISDISTGNFERLEVKILTVGNRVSTTVQPEGENSIAQGLNVAAAGNTSFAQGNSTVASGVYSYARGQFVESSGALSYAAGEGDNPAGVVFSRANNSFVHMSIEGSSSSYGIATGANYSAILGGTTHNIGTNALRSAIIGGTGNSVNASILNSVVIGGSNQTATSNNTVYMPKIVLTNTSTLTQGGAIYYNGSNFIGYNGAAVKLDLSVTSPGNNRVVTTNSTGALIGNSGLLYTGSAFSVTGTISSTGTINGATISSGNITASSLSTGSGAISTTGTLTATNIDSQQIDISRTTYTISPMLTIENTYSTGDASMSFTAGGETYTMGIDNGTDDRFKIYHGTSLGTVYNDSIFEFDPDTYRVGIGGRTNDSYKLCVYISTSDPGAVTDTVALFENDRTGSGVELNIPNRGIHIACGVNQANLASMTGNAVIQRFTYTNYTDVGQIYYTNTGQLYIGGTAVSDERRKANIVKSDIDALDILRNADVYDFNWKKMNPITEEWGPESFDDINRGYIAQRLNEVYPLATKYNEEMDLWEVPKEEMVPVLHEAILQQQTKIEELEQRIYDLENPV